MFKLITSQTVILTFLYPDLGLSLHMLLRNFDDGRHADLVDLVTVRSVAVDVSTAAATEADLPVGALDLQKVTNVNTLELPPP